MKTLKIEIPEGYEINQEKSTFEKIVFKRSKKLPKTWEELEVVSGYFVNEKSEVLKLTSFKCLRANQNIFATEEQAKAAIALAQLSQLREVYRNGWVPDWENCSQDKWSIYPNKETFTIQIFWSCGSFLSFPTKKIAQEFLDTFPWLLTRAKPLMGYR